MNNAGPLFRGLLSRELSDGTGDSIAELRYL